MKKTLITKICLVALGALALVFLALPAMGNEWVSISGYDCFQYLSYLNGAGFGAILFYISPIFILIAAILLVVAAVLKLVNKCEKLANVLTLVSALVLGLFAVLMLVGLLIEGGSPAAGMILTLIVGVAAVVVAFLDRAWGKK